ncbi:14603_t:CDS:2, partial [Dentiscutata erythropus]
GAEDDYKDRSSDVLTVPEEKKASKIILKISKDEREDVINDTPSGYVDLYKKCWSYYPYQRPKLDTILSKLKELSAESSVKFITNNIVTHKPENKDNKTKSTKMNIDTKYSSTDKIITESELDENTIETQCEIPQINVESANQSNVQEISILTIPTLTFDESQKYLINSEHFDLISTLIDHDLSTFNDNKCKYKKKSYEKVIRESSGYFSVEEYEVFQILKLR